MFSRRININYSKLSPNTRSYLELWQCSAEKFHNWEQCPRALEKVGTFEKKGEGHCGENDGPVIWRSKISLPSVYIITDHTLTVNK